MQTIKISNQHYANHLAEHFAGLGQIVMLQNIGSKIILTLEKCHSVAHTKSKSVGEKCHSVAHTKSKSVGEKCHAVAYTFCSPE